MSKILITRRTFQEAEDKLRQAGSEVVIWGEPDSPGYEDLLKEVRDIDIKYLQNIYLYKLINFYNFQKIFNFYLTNCF